MGESITRKRFLQLLAKVGIAAPAILSVGCGTSDGGSGGGGFGGGGGGGGEPKKIDAYKLSRHGQSACNACKSHARFKLFQTRDAANATRAHRGCNCTIKIVRIPEDEAKQYFATSPVFDRRSARPPSREQARRAFGKGTRSSA